jgi:glycosyltransferase involved in cell wall biosynthesis
LSGRLRVVEVLECGGPGGTGNQVAAIVRGLDPARFEVTLAYAVRPGSAPAEFEALASGAARYAHIPEMTREISPALDARAWLKLYRLFREISPHAVHAHSSKAGALGRSSAWLAGVPNILYSPRGYSFLQLDRSPLSRALYRGVEASLSWIGTVAAVSRSEAALASSLWTCRRVSVVRDAYLGTFPPARQERGGPILVCACGRMCCPRNPEAFARLAKRLMDAKIPARCLWIGAGELEGSVRGLARALGVEECLEITGWLPQPEAQARLREADIFVHFSRWEGLPNAVLEAMAAGLPVVASDIPANRELVSDGDNGWIAPDEEALFSRVASLVSDPSARLALGRAGQALVRREFSLERLISELSALYSGVIE